MRVAAAHKAWYKKYWSYAGLGFIISVGYSACRALLMKFSIIMSSCHGSEAGEPTWRHSVAQHNPFISCQHYINHALDTACFICCVDTHRI